MQKFLEGMCLSLTFFFLELFGSGPGCFLGSGGGVEIRHWDCVLIEGLVLFRSGRGRCDSGRDWLVVLDGYLQTEYTLFLSILTLC